MKLIAYATALILITGCTTAPAPVPAPTPTPPPVVTPAPKPPVALTAIAADSACANYYWKDRGRAKVGYIKGMALSYSRSLCRLSSVNDGPSKVMAQVPGDAYKDALAHYGITGKTPAERLKKLYTLMIGLGMRESSGFYGCGRDTSADNVQVDTAETGLYQFSYNLNSASPMLNVVYKEYKADESKCMLNVFKEGFTKPASNDFYGSGEGRYFQELARRCPAFSAEYTAVGLRVNRRHWGPINRKEAEYRQECELMLTDIEKNTICTQ